MKDDYYWFWINNITGIANIKLRYLFKVFDTPEDIYKASDKMFEGVMGIKPDDIYSIKESRKSEYIYREYSELDKKNIKFTYPGKYNYPERLMNIYDYPYIIYYKGRLPQSARSVSSNCRGKELYRIWEVSSRKICRRFCRHGNSGYKWRHLG